MLLAPFKSAHKNSPPDGATTSQPAPRTSATAEARGHQIRVVRTLIEVTVLAAGWLLGGSVGAGTVLYAALIGLITHRTIPLFTPKTKDAERVATP